MTDATAQPSYVDNYQPPVAGDQQPSVPQSVAKSETLEDQNIFDLLGVATANEKEKEAFLDELQQVIWEDFLENDVELLITDQEMTELRQLMSNNQGDQLAQQEAIVTFLEKLIPDLEEIMLEKALELKADMVRERIAGMREYFANQPDTLNQIDTASEMIQNDQWHSGTDALNAIK